MYGEIDLDGHGWYLLRSFEKAKNLCKLYIKKSCIGQAAVGNEEALSEMVYEDHRKDCKEDRKHRERERELREKIKLETFCLALEIFPNLRKWL